jgi:hypothetical protein
MYAIKRHGYPFQRLRITKSPNSPQIGSAFTNSSSAHPIGEDQKILGGDNV